MNQKSKFRTCHCARQDAKEPTQIKTDLQFKKSPNICYSF